MRLSKGFTLIELLIVIVIVLILIAIALPNFLEAQVRAKTANARGELKTLVTATEAYLIDWKGKEPKTNFPGTPTLGGYSEWWGFASPLLSTPVAFVSELPAEPFSDDYTHSIWLATGGPDSDPPYTVVRDTNTSSWPIGSVVSNNQRVQDAAGGPVPISQEFFTRNQHCGYFYYSSGPDRVDSTVWGNPQFYSPTNGTTSFGELYEFGPGSPWKDGRETRE